MNTELPRQFKEVQQDNRDLKHMYADLSLDHSLLKEGIE
jgi:putative transposase